MRRALRRLGFHLLRWLACALALAGPAMLRRGGTAFGTLHYLLGGGKRRRLLRQMARVLAETSDPEWLRAQLLTAYRVNDRAILEILAAYSGALQPEQVAALCQLEQTETLDQALSDGKGVVLLGMHMGNGVAMAIALAARGYPVSVVYRESNKITPAFFRDGLRRQGIDAVGATPPAAGFRGMVKALRNNRILFILMDQASKRGGVPVRFLGKDQDMPPGPAELARRTGAPVIPALLDQVDEQWHFRFAAPMTLQRDRALTEEVKILADVMETHILRHPQWWTWHQRRWQRHPFAPTPTDAPGT